MATERIPSYTIEQYLAIEQEAAEKSEYLAGRIYAMSGVSVAHDQIAVNLLVAIHPQLRGSGSSAHTSDIRIMAGDILAYPDVTKVCGERKFFVGLGDTITNPTVIIEILSPSTERYDRGVKFRAYMECPTVQEYLLVSQFEPRIEGFARSTEGTWVFTAIQGAGEALKLESVPVSLSLADVYEGVNFE